MRATGAPRTSRRSARCPTRPTSESLYAALGVPWCPPELREAPFRGEPPPLVELADIRGDLHCHTTWSDGKASVLEMALAARELGHEYLAICDHTPNVRVVPGLDADALRRQAEEIAAANEQVAPFRILRGAEVDIRRDGSLDLPDDVLAELDWVQLSLHAGQREEGEALTRKVTEAMRHPAVRCLSHPTGRLIRHRPPNALDLERVIEVALETGVALEVNGLPDRLDLRDEHVRLAVEAGVPIVSSTDAHSTRGLGNLELAVARPVAAGRRPPTCSTRDRSRTSPAAARRRQRGEGRDRRAPKGQGSAPLSQLSYSRCSGRSRGTCSSCPSCTIRPPHLAHSTASSKALKSAVWPGGGAGAASAASAAPPFSRMSWASREALADLGAQDPELLLGVGVEELLAHPAEDVVDEGLGDADVRVVREAARLEAHVRELRDVDLERHAVLEAERDRDHERVHEAGEGRALLGDVDEDVAGRAVVVEADVDVALVVADAELAADLGAVVGQAAPVCAFGTGAGAAASLFFESGCATLQLSR